MNNYDYNDIIMEIDGKGIFNIEMPGKGVWVSNLSFRVSGDAGVDKVTGIRKIFSQIASSLEELIFPSKAKFDTLVPAGNFERMNYVLEKEETVELIHTAIDELKRGIKKPADIKWENKYFSITLSEATN